MQKYRTVRKENHPSIGRVGQISLVLVLAGCAAARTVDRKDSRPAAAVEPGREQTVRLVDYQDAENRGRASRASGPLADIEQPPPSEKLGDDRYPVDLTTALQLAGANNLQIALASERVCEAQARLEGAEALWIPSLVGGAGYNRHDGQIQNSDGTISSAGRSSLFLGGGPALGNLALPGGTTGASRLGVDLSLADVLFQPLAARQSVRAAQANQSAAFNDVLLQVAVTYEDLVRAQTRLAVAQEAVQNAQTLATVTGQFARSGVGLEADSLRAQAELADRRREVLAADEHTQVISTELARLLRLDPRVSLIAVDTQPLPLTLIEEETPLPELIAQGLTQRPELARHQAEVAETLERLRQEEWRPWIPHLFAGYSAGGLGGGVNSSFQSLGGRSDFDALAVWELKNLGFGTRAVQRQRESQNRQAHLAVEQISDQIAADVARAYHQSRFRKQQIQAAQSQVRSAAESLELNFKGISGGAGLRPIEAQQAIAAIAAARNQYASAVVDYNQAQFQLLRAVGRPPQ